MLKLNASGNPFGRKNNPYIMLVSEGKVWEVGENWIRFRAPVQYCLGLEDWQETNIDYVANETNIFTTLKQHSFLWPEYSYLLYEEDGD